MEPVQNIPNCNNTTVTATAIATATTTQQYVLKTIWIDRVSARDRRNAMQEAALLSRLRHPNIVK